MEPTIDITNTPLAEAYKKMQAGGTPTLPKTEPTVGSLYNVPTEQDTALDSAISSTQGVATTPINEGEIRQRTLDSFQREIDATNSVYADMLRQVRQKGQETMGQSGAIQARSGLLGSDFGAAQTKKVETANVEAEQSVEAEKLAKLAEIMGEARTAASSEIEARRKAQQEGLDSYLNYQATKADRKTSNVNKLISSMFNKGVDATKLSDKEMGELATSYGVSKNDITNAYSTEQVRREKETADKLAEATKPFELGEGQRRYTYNAKTGQYELSAYNPKTFAPEKATDGTGLSPEQTKTQLGFLKTVADDALKVADAAGRSGMRRAGEAWFVGSTDYTQLESLTNTLKTNLLTLNTDPTVKKFFGPQMSNADVKLMMAGGTTLDPELNTPEQIKAEIGRVKNLFDRIDAAVPGGINPVINGQNSGAVKAPDGTMVIITD
jgi:hypothetical protein